MLDSPFCQQSTNLFCIGTIEYNKYRILSLLSIYWKVNYFVDFIFNKHYILPYYVASYTQILSKIVDSALINKQAFSLSSVFCWLYFIFWRAVIASSTPHFLQQHRVNTFVEVGAEYMGNVTGTNLLSQIRQADRQEFWSRKEREFDVKQWLVFFPVSTNSTYVRRYT